MRKRKGLFLNKGYTFLEVILVSVMIPMIAFAVYATFSNCLNLLFTSSIFGENLFYDLGQGHLPQSLLQLREDLSNSKYFAQNLGSHKFALFQDPHSDGDQTILVFQTLLPSEDRMSGGRVPGVVAYFFQHPGPGRDGPGPVAFRVYLYYNEMFHIPHERLMDRFSFIMFAENYNVEYLYLDQAAGGYEWGQRQEDIGGGAPYLDIDPIAVRLTVMFPGQNITSTFWRRTAGDSGGGY